MRKVCKMLSVNCCRLELSSNNWQFPVKHRNRHVWHPQVNSLHHSIAQTWSNMVHNDTTALQLFDIVMCGNIVLFLCSFIKESLCLHCSTVKSQIEVALLLKIVSVERLNYYCINTVLSTSWSPINYKLLQLQKIFVSQGWTFYKQEVAKFSM